LAALPLGSSRGRLAPRRSRPDRAGSVTSASGCPTPVGAQQAAFLRGLRELGWIECQNVTIE